MSVACGSVASIMSKSLSSGRRLVGAALCRELGRDGHWLTKWCCENVPNKQKWIRDAVCHACDPPCIFDDICTLSKDPKCVVHSPQASCALACVHIAIAGWSCKTLSKLNTQYKKGLSKDALRTGSGSSGQTLKGLCNVLKALRVPIYLGENVEELADPWSDNRIAFLEVAILF